MCCLVMAAQLAGILPSIDSGRACVHADDNLYSTQTFMPAASFFVNSLSHAGSYARRLRDTILNIDLARRWALYRQMAILEKSRKKQNANLAGSLFSDSARSGAAIGLSDHLIMLWHALNARHEFFINASLNNVAYILQKYPTIGRISVSYFNPHQIKLLKKIVDQPGAQILLETIFIDFPFDRDRLPTFSRIETLLQDMVRALKLADMSRQRRELAKSAETIYLNTKWRQPIHALSILIGLVLEAPTIFALDRPKASNQRYLFRDAAAYFANHAKATFNQAGAALLPSLDASVVIDILQIMQKLVGFRYIREVTLYAFYGSRDHINFEIEIPSRLWIKNTFRSPQGVKLELRRTWRLRNGRTTHHIRRFTVTAL